MEATETSVKGSTLLWKLPRSHLRGNFHGSFHWKLPWTYRCKFPWKLPWKLVLWKLPWKFWTGPISAEVLEASMKASSMEDSVDFSVESSVEATPKGIHGSFRGRNSYGHPRKLPEAPVETFMEASSTVSVEAASVEASVLPRKLPSLPRKLPSLSRKFHRFHGSFYRLPPKKHNNAWTSTKKTQYYMEFHERFRGSFWHVHGGT